MNVRGLTEIDGTDNRYSRVLIRRLKMNESVLNSIKQMLGITPEQTDFDQDILIHINSVLNIMHQLGVIKEWINISDTTTKWSDLSTEAERYSMMKSYMYLKVRLLFDPPLNATVISSMERQISELEWRLLENHNDKEEITNG